MHLHDTDKCSDIVVALMEAQTEIQKCKIVSYIQLTILQQYIDIHACKHVIASNIKYIYHDGMLSMHDNLRYNIATDLMLVRKHSEF